MQQPQIVEKPALTVMGYEAPFIHGLSPETTNFKIIPLLWDRLMHDVGRIPNRVDRAMYGVIVALPESQRSHPHELQYLAGVAVSSIAEAPQGMTARTIPAGTFAVFLHRGPIQNIGETVIDIYRRWLPQSDYNQANVPDVELYDHRFQCEGGVSVMEYWIGVSPKVSSPVSVEA